MALILRDRFSCLELHRAQVEPSGGTCSWCGGTNARRKLFAYRVEGGGGHKSDVRGTFCSIRCMRAYS
jgi:hypothetical protein